VRVEAIDRLDAWQAFAVVTVGSLMQLAVVVLTFNLIYAKSQAIGGWDNHQMLVLLGTYYVIEAVSWATYVRGYTRLHRMVESGTLDVYLCRPVRLQAFLFFRFIDPIFFWPQLVTAIGLIWYGSSHLTAPPNWLAYLLYLACGFVIHASFIAMVASVNFWAIFRRPNQLQGEVFALGLYPMGIYPGVVRFILSFIIPVAFAYNVPAAAMFGGLATREAILAPVMAIVFFAVSTIVWNAGLRRYESANG
jgi:ABC-2 type transport system permease protein